MGPSSFQCHSVYYNAPPDQSRASALVSVFQMLVCGVVGCTTFLIAKKNKLISANSALNERSIVQFELKPEQLRVRLYEGNREALKDLNTLIVEQKHSGVKVTIDKQFTLYNLYNKIFDFSTYALIPAVLFSAIGVISAVLYSALAVPVFSIVVPLFILVVAAQGASLFLLYQEHKAIDKNIKTLLDKEVSRLEKTVEAMKENERNTLLYQPNSAESEEMLNTLKNCNPMNLIIAVRDLNLVSIQKSIDEYNKLLEKSTCSPSFELDLMDTQLVNNIIIILGSLFINEQNKYNCGSYESYIKATKRDILTLINSPYINSVAPLISCFSGCNNYKTDKDYSILKQAIVAKLEGITSLAPWEFPSAPPPPYSET